MEVLNGLVQWITTSIGNFTPEQEKNFAKHDYNPLYGGMHGAKVGTSFRDRPGINLKTNYWNPPKEINNFNGRHDKHPFLSNPLFIEAWRQRKMTNFNQPHRFLAPEFNRPFRHKEVRWLDGAHVSSRDPYRKKRATKVYDKVSKDSSV